jgi:CIC family chloride channel protein
VALRKRTLYHAQVPTQRDSPVHKIDSEDLLRSVQVARVMRVLPTPVPTPPDGGAAVTAEGAASEPAVDAPAAQAPTVPVIAIRADLDLRAAGEALRAHKLREVAVTDESGRVIGLLDETDIAHFYLDATATKGPDRPDEP